MELLEIYTLVICEIRVHNIQCSFEYIIQSGMSAISNIVSVYGKI